jgi:predicted membrane protein
MAAGADGQARMGRSLAAARDFASLPGWCQLLITLAAAGMIAAIALLAGVPSRWAPLVLGGALGILLALVAGAPRRDDRDP